MKIATILFTYNRARHTLETLEALKNNTIKPCKLFIFQDGLKNEQSRKEWMKVNEIVNSVDWCEHEIIVSEYNQGLANAIYAGVSYVFKFYDAVIVLEDDCVSHPLFMAFMYKALEKYESENRVYHVCANALPYTIPSNGTDAYFSGRIDTWGWGTWKDRWVNMQMDYTILARIKKNEKLNKELEVWGRDFESYLLGNVYGTCSSWAAFWGLTVIERGGLCLSAYDSFIEQIGFDGLGTNCGAENIEQRLRPLDNLKEVSLPDEIEIEDGVKPFYREYSAWTAPDKRLLLYNKCLEKIVNIYRNGKRISDKLKEIGVTNVGIWGKGNITDILIDDFEGEINISNIILSKTNEKKYRAIDVVNIQNLSDDVQLVIVIPTYDKDIIIPKIKSGRQCRIIGIDELLDA